MFVHSVQILLKNPLFELLWFWSWVSIYHESFEVDIRLLYTDVVLVHKLGQLWNIVTCKLEILTNYYDIRWNSTDKWKFDQHFACPFEVGFMWGFGIYITHQTNHKQINLPCTNFESLIMHISYNLGRREWQVLLTCVALSRNVEITVLVLRKSLEPFHQENVRVLSCK